MFCVMYHIKALSVVIRTTFKISTTFSSVKKKQFRIFPSNLFWSSYLSYEKICSINGEIGFEDQCVRMFFVMFKSFLKIYNKRC